MIVWMIGDASPMDSDLEELNNEKANSQPLAQRIQTSRSHERSAMSGDKSKKPSDKMLTLVGPTRPSGERAAEQVEMEKLAAQTALEFRACSRELRTLQPKIQHIQDYFASSVRGSVTLAGCSSFKEYCEKKLGRTRQAIYALLGNYPQKQKEKQKRQTKGEHVYNGGLTQDDVTRMQTGLNAVYRFQVAKSNGNQEEARCAWQEYEHIASAEPLKSRIAGDQPNYKAMLVDLLLVSEEMVAVLHKILDAGIVMDDASVSVAAESCTSKAEKLCNAYRRRLAIPRCSSGTITE